MFHEIKMLDEGGKVQWTIRHHLLINMLVVRQMEVPVKKRPLPI